MSALISISCATLLLAHDLPLAANADIVEVWIVLSEPSLAKLPRDANEQRNALRRRLVRQQDDVMAQLATLGATELARVRYARNAIAVSLPSSAIERARKIEGVTSIQRISDRNRIGD